MNLTQLKYFYAVAQHQHVTATAEALNIAQPALTQTINRLEKELGVPLFVKAGRRIMLTEYGRYLQSELAPVIETLDRIPEDLRAMAEKSDKTVRLNVLAASVVVTEAVVEYKNRHHDISIQLQNNRNDELSDISISNELAPQKNDRVGMSFTIPEEIFLAVPNNEKYSNMKKIALADAAEEEYICLAGSKQLRRITDALCRQAGFTPHITFESEDSAAVRNCIAAGLGVGFWPQFTWGGVNGTLVKLLPITDPKCERDLVINCSAGAGAEAERFYDFLVGFLLRKQREHRV